MKTDDIEFSLSALSLPVVTFIGPPGSGKTEVGNLLAQQLGWTFWDTDVLIEQATGLTVAEIFVQHGQETFRALEKRLIEKIGRLYGVNHESQDKGNRSMLGTIISTGGGLPVLAENLAVLSKIGTLITLYASIDVLTERTGHKENRPLLNPSGVNDSEPDKQLRLKQLVAERQHIYDQANLKIDTSKLTVTGVVDLVKEKLKVIV